MKHYQEKEYSDKAAREMLNQLDEKTGNLHPEASLLHGFTLYLKTIIYKQIIYTLINHYYII